MVFCGIWLLIHGPWWQGGEDPHVFVISEFIIIPLLTNIPQLWSECLNLSAGLKQFRRVYDVEMCILVTQVIAISELFFLIFNVRFMNPRNPVFTRGQFWPSGIVVACVCVCVCVRVSVNHEFVRAITHQPFKLWSPNVDQRCKRPWLRALLFCGMIDRYLKGQIELQSQNLPHFELVHAITHHQLKLQFPNLEQKCILALFRSLPILGLIEFDLQFIF